MKICACELQLMKLLAVPNHILCSLLSHSSCRVAIKNTNIELRHRPTGKGRAERLHAIVTNLVAIEVELLELRHRATAHKHQTVGNAGARVVYADIHPRSLPTTSLTLHSHTSHFTPPNNHTSTFHTPRTHFTATRARSSPWRNKRSRRARVATALRDAALRNGAARGPHPLRDVVAPRDELGVVPHPQVWRRRRRRSARAAATAGPPRCALGAGAGAVG
eukprot:6044453-Prymnesium_polylepis.1